MDVQVKVSFVVIELKLNDKVIFIFKAGCHSVIKTDYQPVANINVPTSLHWDLEQTDHTFKATFMS